jgi:hypothetical protein
MRLIGLAVTTILVLAIGNMASNTFAFDEPAGFRGVPWQSTEAVLKAKLDVGTPDDNSRGIQLCYDYPAASRWLGDRGCAGMFLLGGARISAVYGFRGDRFVRVLLSFRTVDYDQVAAAFRERYGLPTSEYDEPYQIQGGLKTTNRISRWMGTTVSIELRRLSTKVTEGGARLATMAELEESTRLKREQTKDAAKDL